MNKDTDFMEVAITCKYSEIININCGKNIFLATLLNDELDLESAKKLYEAYEEEFLPKSTEVGIHIVTNRNMIYLFKEGKVVYEDNHEEEIPFEQIDQINRIIRVKDNRGHISELYLKKAAEALLRANGVAQNLYNIKQAFLNCKIKVIDGVVYVNEPIVFVFLNLIRNKVKKFVIKINSSTYDKDAMKVFFSVYRNLKLICKDDMLASITPGVINVKKNDIYKTAKFLHKRCELI